jgi:hypothetical protein
MKTHSRCKAAQAVRWRSFRAGTFNDQHLICKPLKRLLSKRSQLPITLKDRILKLRSLTVCAAHIYPPLRLGHNLSESERLIDLGHGL